MEPNNLQILMDINSTNESDKIFSFSKNKIKLASQFDHKGAKQFLHEKEKALQKVILDDEINIVNKKSCKKCNSIQNTKHHHHHHFNKDKLKLEKLEKLEKFPTFGENDGSQVFIS